MGELKNLIRTKKLNDLIRSAGSVPTVTGA
jgi:hypothetical protein